MTTPRAILSRRYRADLQRHLRNGIHTGAKVANKLGTRAVADGLDTLDLARIHEQSLIEILAPEGLSTVVKAEMIARASKFFTEAITPISKTHHAAVETNARLNKLNAELKRHALELASTNKRLTVEILRRKAVEASLKKSKLHYAQLLDRSVGMQEQLRHLAHRIILTQEAERKEISRELHDQIAQTLAGINVHLAALKVEAESNTRGLARKITSTQRIVEQSVKIVHRFARELRPTVLDDLGLIPALRTYLKEFSGRSSIPVAFTFVKSAEKLTGDERTVMYRVAQAALTNVAQHSKATEASLDIRKAGDDMVMEVHDNGVAFDVQRVLHAKRHKRLGVLGMRERVDMVGGVFEIESAAGKGTTVRARIKSMEKSDE